MNEGISIFLFVFLGIVAVVLAITIPLSVINEKYKAFVLLHSVAIKELRNINKHYIFNSIREYNQSNSYDNENYYDMISPKDYLIYQLVYIQKEVLTSLNDTYGNKIMFEEYKKEITEKCHLNTFDTDELLKNREKLEKIEKKLFEKEIKTPRTEYWINVYLELRKMNGAYVCSKQDFFYSKDIRSLIGRINNKRNGFYYDEEIWKSICRVERGKVSNKLRFAIYDRDGHRCRKCGRRTDDLEIDHIIPISKGGKTTYDNLQTLCKYCNKMKGSKIESSGNSYTRW